MEVLSCKGTAASPVDGCVLQVQAGGHHLPAEVDSDIVSHRLNKIWKEVDVVPSVTNGKVLLGSLTRCIGFTPSACSLRGILQTRSAYDYFCPSVCLALGF